MDGYDISKMLSAASEAMMRDFAKELDEIGGRICDSMKENLVSNGSIDTGALHDSVRRETKETADGVETLIYADAKNDENGAQYAEFLEYGTGIHNERGDGRQTPWHYKDKQGNWHTTRGMTPRPFIRTAVASHEKELPEAVRTTFDLNKYMRGGD